MKNSEIKQKKVKVRGTGCYDPVRYEITYYNGRPSLSRCAKYLLKLLKKRVPEEVLEHAEMEFAVEPRRVQNEMAEKLFAILIDASWDCSLDNARQTLKLDDLAHRILASVNPFRLSRCE